MTINVGATTVANKHQLDKEYPGWHTDDHFVYIGRKRQGMHYGNPFSSRPRSLAEVKVRSRQESIDACQQWLKGEAYQEVEPQRRAWILENMWRLRGKTLVCFCHPQPCHGHIYVAMLD